MMRPAAFLIFLHAAFGITFACHGLEIDVGTTSATGAPEASPEVATFARDAGEDTAVGDGASVLDQCRTAGAYDPYDTGRELTDRLVGSWAQCPGEAESPLPCSPDFAFWGIRFRADGTWVLLGAPTEEGDYVEEEDDCANGRYEYRALREADGGPIPGDPEEIIDRDSDVPHNGIFVRLHTAQMGNVAEYPVFQRKPRRLELSLGGGGRRRNFVPLAPRIP